MRRLDPKGPIPQAAALLRSNTCRECGAPLYLTARNRPRPDRRCRECVGGILSRVPEHARQEAAGAVHSTPPPLPWRGLDLGAVRDRLVQLIRDTLPPVEAFVLLRRLRHGDTLAKVAEGLDVTGERVRQLEARAIAALEAAHKKELKRLARVVADHNDLPLAWELVYRGPFRADRAASAPPSPAPAVPPPPPEPEVVPDLDALADLLTRP